MCCDANRISANIYEAFMAVLETCKMLLKSLDDDTEKLSNMIFPIYSSREHIVTRADDVYRHLTSRSQSGHIWAIMAIYKRMADNHYIHASVHILKVLLYPSSSRHLVSATTITYRIYVDNHPSSNIDHTTYHQLSKPP